MFNNYRLCLISIAINILSNFQENENISFMFLFFLIRLADVLGCVTHSILSVPYGKTKQILKNYFNLKSYLLHHQSYYIFAILNP